MARYVGPVCKLCRREGMKLYLKGERCYSEKCAYTRRPYPSAGSAYELELYLTVSNCEGLARGLYQFVGACDVVLYVHTVDDADDRGLYGHLLIAYGRARGLPVRAQHDLAYACAETVCDDDDVSGRLLVQVNRVDNQKLDALQIGRLLR